MTPRDRVVGRNILVALGLWWCFSFLGMFVLWGWNSVFVFNRVFTGPSGDALRLALSLPGYLIVGFLVGLGVARFIDSSNRPAWAAGLSLLIALADAKSWNTMRYRGRSVPETTVVAIAIIASIGIGCWVGLRLEERRGERGEVA